MPPRTRGHGLGQVAPGPLGQVHATLQLVDLAGSECAGERGEPQGPDHEQMGLPGVASPQCPLSLAPPSWCRLSTKTLSVSSDAALRAPSREGSPPPTRLSLPGPQVVMGERPVTGSPPLSLAEGTLPTMPLFCFSDAF